MLFPLFSHPFDITKIAGYVSSGTGDDVSSLSDGASVSTWGTIMNGQAGITKTTTSFNGKTFAALSFNGTGAKMFMNDNTGPSTIILVNKYTSIGVSQDTAIWGNFAYFYKDGSDRWGIGRNGVTDETQYASASTVIGTSNFHIHAGTYDNTGGQTITSLYLDGVQKSTLTTSSSGGSGTVGISPNGDVAMILYAAFLFNRALNADEIRYVSTGLALKTGITLANP